MTENPSRRPLRPGRPGARLRSRAHRVPTWSVLPACALVGALAGGVYGVAKTPEYTATSYVIAVPTAKSDPATALGFAQAYGRVATQLAVLGDAQVWAGVPVGTLRDSVRAETSPDAPMVAISATAPRPAQAADIANAVSRALTINANQTERDTRVQLLQFSRAVKPAEPTSTSAPVTALVGGCAGALIGGLALLVRPRRVRDDLPASVPSPAPAADLQR
ncbi:lipopolysaccharide biosynthesis protein [Streptomyces sp. NPDC091292]|uniref:lipopolysaccharide biosynthesis protein n=1 Tax=Streptomyces sp. NPDC091292 TaxID=3365991 RepID=UPI00381BC48B